MMLLCVIKTSIMTYVLRKFASTTDKRVCVAVLELKEIANQPKIILASCHVPARTLNGDSRAKYSKKMLKKLENLGKEMNYPVIVAGDFNCDLIKNNNHNFTVPKYDPTIHRVICSGGNSNPCIDFFAYKQEGAVVVKVHNVRAELASNASDVLSSDKYKFLQYQERLKKKSTCTLDTKIHKMSDYDPIKATLTIVNVQDQPIETNTDEFNILYFNLERT